MRKTIQIGERQIEMLGNAATALIYKQTFHEDLLKAVASLSGASSDEMILAIEKVQRLSFVMNKQATESFSVIKGLKEEDFVLWLSMFEEDDFQNPSVFSEILGVWNKNLSGSSEPKNA